MSWKCEICGKGFITGNNISHAHNLTRRRWRANLHKVRVVVNGTVKRIRICTRCLRSRKVVKAS